MTVLHEEILESKLVKHFSILPCFTVAYILVFGLLPSKATLRHPRRDTCGHLNLRITQKGWTQLSYCKIMSFGTAKGRPLCQLVKGKQIAQIMISFTAVYA